LFFHTVPPANTLVRWVNENAFAPIVQARPCPTFGRPVHPGFPHRLRPGTSPHALRIPSRDGHPALRVLRLPGQRGFIPAFGYGTPHLSTRGTLTLLNNALLSAHYRVVRLLQHPSVLPPVDPWLHVPPDPLPEAVLLVWEEMGSSLRFLGHPCGACPGLGTPASRLDLADNGRTRCCLPLG